MALRVRFWGTRGSIPTPKSPGEQRAQIAAVLRAARSVDLASDDRIEAFLDAGAGGALPTLFGGETSCVEVVEESGPRLILDLGSGARALGHHLLTAVGPVAPGPYHILMSHLHWDHIQGLPFFPPAYIKGNVLHIHGCHDGIEAALRREYGAPSFPVPFDALGAEIVFHRLAPGQTSRINGFEVTPLKLRHAGDAYAYRIERGGRRLVYATDGEHKPEDVRPDYPYVGFVRAADLLIFDAQYSLAEAVTMKEDWGHSSNVVGVELALMAGVRHLVLFHHEPLNSDARLAEIVADARRLADVLGGGGLVVSGAADGLELVL